MLEVLLHGGTPARALECLTLGTQCPVRDWKGDAQQMPQPQPRARMVPTPFSPLLWVRCKRAIDLIQEQASRPAPNLANEFHNPGT